MTVCHRNYELLGIAQVCSLHLHNKSCKNHQRYFKRHVQSADSRVRTDQTALVALCAEIHVHLCHKLRAACALGIRRWRHGIKGHGAAKYAKLCQIKPLTSHFGAMETPALGTLMAIPRFSYWLVPKGTRPPGTKVLTGKEFPSSEPQQTWETRAKLAKLPLHDESIPDPWGVILRIGSSWIILDLLKVQTSNLFKKSQASKLLQGCCTPSANCLGAKSTIFLGPLAAWVDPPACSSEEIHPLQQKTHGSKTSHPNPITSIACLFYLQTVGFLWLFHIFHISFTRVSHGFFLVFTRFRIEPTVTPSSTPGSARTSPGRAISAKLAGTGHSVMPLTEASTPSMFICTTLSPGSGSADLEISMVLRN